MPVIQGQLPASLANEVSNAIHRALERGMEVDEAASVVVAVAADYGRGKYGDAFLVSLVNVVLYQCGRPHPVDISRNGAN